METDFDVLRLAANKADRGALKRLILAGADVNARGADGTPLLSQVIMDLGTPGEQDARRYAVVATLLDLGANPNGLDHTGEGPLWSPAIVMDTAMLRLLLERGCNPNHGCAGGYDFMTIYDEALGEYLWSSGLLAEQPKPGKWPQSRPDPLTFLKGLDMRASAMGVQRPEHLFLLRAHGALKSEEIGAQLGAVLFLEARWRDDGWRLVEVFPAESGVDDEPVL